MSSFRDFVARQEAAATPDERQRLDEARERFRYAAELAEIRQTRGLSQRQLASACGVPQSEISRIESGAANPTAKTLTALSAALGARLSVQPLDL